MDQDQEQLRLLSIFHYVVGGLIGLFACFPIIHLVVGIALVSGVMPESSKQPEMDRTMGWFFIALGSFAIVAGWTLATTIVIAGRMLAKRRYYTFCLVVAAIQCMAFPFGTVLGVFTIIVLVRPSVRLLFEQASSSPG